MNTAECLTALATAQRHGTPPPDSVGDPADALDRAAREYRRMQRTLDELAEEERLEAQEAEACVRRQKAPALRLATVGGRDVRGGL